MNTSPTIAKIAPALLKAQITTGAAKKDAKNPFFHSNYADLGSVMEACKSALNDNGIVVLQPVVDNNVETVLIHESGEWMASRTPIVVKEQNNPQALGSAISYARRYGLQSMVFIPAEDDDGNTATRQPETAIAGKNFPDDTTPVLTCPTHGKPFINGKYGMYCPTKTEDGKWCKNKPGIDDPNVEIN